MKIKIRLDDPHTKALWACALRAKQEVDSWPAWKRGEMPYLDAFEEEVKLGDIVVVAARHNSYTWLRRCKVTGFNSFGKPILLDDKTKSHRAYGGLPEAICRLNNKDKSYN